MIIRIDTTTGTLREKSGAVLARKDMPYEDSLFWLYVTRYNAGGRPVSRRPVVCTTTRAWAIRMARTVLNHLAMVAATPDDSTVTHCCAPAELPRYLIPVNYEFRAADGGRVDTCSLFQFPGGGDRPASPLAEQSGPLALRVGEPSAAKTVQAVRSLPGICETQLELKGL